MSGKVVTLIALALCLAGTIDTIKAADHWLESHIKDTPIETAKIQWNGTAGQQVRLYYFPQWNNNMCQIGSVDSRNLEKLLTDFPVSNNWQILRNGGLPNEDKVSITPCIFPPGSILLMDRPEDISGDIVSGPGFVWTENSNPNAADAMMFKITRNNTNWE